ncbi:MAG: glycerol-3-phosphate dehydrogenase [Planctomycetota bacterium]
MKATGPPADGVYDLLIIGGGIHGACLARDAAGRGHSVLLCERDDLASGTSSASSKLIHGGLRYLEHGAFRLVRESLAEREVLLSTAPHLVQPLRFVMPHVSGLRPVWMIRLGLWLYDRLGGRRTLPVSEALTLSGTPFGEPLRPEWRRGYLYSDCRTDDARLVLANARAAADLGARIATRTEFLSARREGGLWRAELRRTATGSPRTVSGTASTTAATAAATAALEVVLARAVINAAGPWALDVQATAAARPPRAGLRFVQGSHIVVPRLYQGEHAYMLQQPDRRIVFVMPFEEEFTCIGTTEVVRTAPSLAEVTPAEVQALCEASNRFLRRSIAPSDVLWSFCGMRALVAADAQGGATGRAADNPSQVSREYRIEWDGRRRADAGPPLLTILGGKLTTARRLAERALDELYGQQGSGWTATAPLPGGDLPAGANAPARLAALLTNLTAAWPHVPPAVLAGLARRHGTQAADLLAQAGGQLGTDFGGGLYEAELRWMRAHEWASHVDDIIARRSKAVLRLSLSERRALEQWLQH